jgi:hypothetical protein
MPVPVSHVRVSTSQYRAAHGREPRGEGLWVFQFAGESVTRSFYGSFPEARREATRAAARYGVRSVEVCS